MPGYAGSALLIQHAKACTPNDSNSHFTASSLNATHANGTRLSNAIMIGTAGNVTIVLADGNSLVLPALIVGVWHTCPPFEHVRATGTTATVTAVGATYK